MKITTVLFDLDGTLLNTLDDLAASVNYALRECGMTQRSREEIRTFVGNGVATLIARAVPAGTAPQTEQRCLSLMKEHYQQNMANKTCPYDGITDLLTTLKSSNIKMAVISNKFDSAVKELCQQWFGNWITSAVGESATVPKKPSPLGVLKALELLEARPEQALYIGDSEVDILTAKNAGLRSVGVSWGFRSRSDLQQAGADFIIDQPSELIELIGLKLK